MSNKTITEIQNDNEECNFLQPHIGGLIVNSLR